MPEPDRSTHARPHVRRLPEVQGFLFTLDEDAGALSD